MQAETVVFQTATKPARNPLWASLNDTEDRPESQKNII